jgi:hypothetical protein
MQRDQTMTTRQIAEAVGKEERTVRNWIKKVAERMTVVAEKSSVSSPMNPATYDLDETCAIIEAGLGKNAASLFRENAIRQGLHIVPADTSAAYAMMAAAFERLARITEMQESRLQRIESRIEERQALLPAPALEPRQRVNMLVREHATSAGIPFSAAWRDLYREFAYRTHTNPSQAAKNRGMPILDYIEAEGMIETLEAVAAELHRGVA